MSPRVTAPLVLAALTAVLFAAGSAAASHADDRFTSSGHVTVGNPATQFTGGASEVAWSFTGEENPEGAPLEGVDGDVVDLPDWAPGHTLWVNGTPDPPAPDAQTPYDLDIYFYDDNRSYIADTSCATGGADETCAVPGGASYAVVDLWAGVEVDYELTLRSVSSAGGATGGTFAITPWFTWDHADLDVVIVPPATGPLYDRDAQVLPAGAGLGPDSPYVEATEDAIQAWDEGLAAYAAQNASAGYLADFSFDVSVVGDDATRADLDEADIRIAYGFTGGPILGTSFSTETDGDRFVQCDIVNQQWLAYSFTANDAYNVYGHEFGHCLGLEHPPAPAKDLMAATYDPPIGDPANDRICISTLDAKGLAEAYAWMGDEDPTWEAPPEQTEMPEGDYDVFPAVDADGSCPNRPSEI